MNLKVIKIYFDGGSYGPDKNAYGSYEVVSDVSINHKQVRMEFEPLTSNQAEYRSLIAALKWLRHRVEDFDYSLLIHTDSQLLERQMKGSYRCRVLHLKELKDELEELLSPYRYWRIDWHSRVKNVSRFGH